MNEFSAVAEEGRQSLGEEIANSISHGVGVLAALVGAPILIWTAAVKGDVLTVASVSIFAASMVVLYVISMVYHCLPHNRAKRLFRIFDHIAIFLLIAGTYTPFALVPLRGAVGWTLFALAWGAALVGIASQLVPRLRHSPLSLVLYLGMGWMIVFFAYPLCAHLPLGGLLWLIAGGVAYTVGVIFYVATSKYCHFAWHLFTLAGTTCHFFAILWYVV